MKRLSLKFSGLMAIAFAACTNDDFLPDALLLQSVGQPIIVTAYTAGNDVSTRIDQTWETDVMKLSWSDDDMFSVIRGGENSTFSKSTEEGANANDFTGTLPTNGEGEYFAVYPVTETTNHEAVPFDISNQSNGLPYLMYTASETGSTYNFCHAVAYLKATFPEILKGKTATITLTLPDQVYADGTINLTNGVLNGNSNNSITKAMTFDNENTEVLFAIPPMPANNKTLKLSAVTDDATYVATLAGDSKKAIEAGKYYTAGIPLTVLGELSDAKTFNDAIKNFLNTNNLTKIKFIADSEETSEMQIGESGVYLLVGNDNTLEIHTAASEFIFPANCESMFYFLTDLTSVDFNNCVNTENVTTMAEMFDFCSALTSLDLSSFNTENVTTMAKMFYSCYELESLDLSNFNTASVTTMAEMFDSCSALTSLDLSSFNTENVTTMAEMFYGCSKLESLDLSNFNTTSLKTMESMFSGCSVLDEIKFGANFTAASVESMESMFKDCEYLPLIDLSYFNTASVTTMESMFKSCSALTSLDLSSFNTENVTTMAEMFYGCSKLESLDLSNFNTASVTTMKSMFQSCEKLTSITFGANFTAASVKSMERMFYNCIAMTSIDLSYFDTTSLKTMKRMFEDCEKLTSITFGANFTAASVESMENMFKDCEYLPLIDLSKFNTASVTTMKSMFSGCYRLESLDLSNFTFKAETNYTSMFAGTGSSVVQNNTNELIPIYVKDEEDKTTLENAVTLIFSQIIVKSNGL